MVPGRQKSFGTHVSDEAFIWGQFCHQQTNDDYLEF